MKTLHVYFVTDTDMGAEVTLTPRVPDSVSSLEDQITPRICCAMSIYDCITSIEAFCTIKNSEHIMYYVYEADVSVENISQPTANDIPDVWFTNELWITTQQRFTLYDRYIFRRQLKLPGSPYSRYSMRRESEDEVVDRIMAQNVYGDTDSFSFIATDVTRRNEFIR